MGRLERWLSVGAVVGGLIAAVAATGQESKDGGQPRWEGDGPYTIVATTGMIADAARNVVGEERTAEAEAESGKAQGGPAAAESAARAEVIGLMKSGVDPHLFKPTRSDMITLTRADVVLYNGLMLEGKLTDALVRVSRAGRDGRGKPVYAVAEETPRTSLLETSQGQYDPHVWMDPAVWRQVVKAVADRLSEFDAAGAATYAANFEAYDAQLEALESWAEQALATVPAESRVLVTAHDAFGYFGRRFGYEVVGIQGISTESEAGIRDIERLVDLLVTRKVKAVFVESTVSDRNVQALIEGAKRRGHDVVIGGQLFSDAMGEEGTYEGTYIGMIDHNVTTIVRALGGDAPERGMQGKLAAPAAGE